MQRAISGDCVAWNPEMAPQAMVVKSIGTIGKFFASAMQFSKEVNSGMVYSPPKSNTTRIPRAMNSSAKPKTG